MNSSFNNPDAFLKTFRSLECRCCQESFGYQSRAAKDVIFCSDKCIQSHEQGGQRGLKIPAHVQPTVDISAVHEPKPLKIQPTVEIPVVHEPKPLKIQPTVEIPVVHEPKPLKIQPTVEIPVVHKPKPLKVLAYAQPSRELTKFLSDRFHNTLRSMDVPAQVQPTIDAPKKKQELPDSSATLMKVQLLSKLPPPDVAPMQTLESLSPPVVQIYPSKKLEALSKSLHWGPCLTLNVPIKVRVTHDAGPTDIYIQTQQGVKMTRSVSWVIRTMIEANVIKPMAGSDVGTLCFAGFEDDWYRAEIIECDPKADAVVVFFCDYGNSAPVLKTELYEWPTMLFGDSRFCYQCQWDVGATDEIPDSEKKAVLAVDELEVTPTMEIGPGQFLVSLAGYKVKSKLMLVGAEMV